MASSERAPLLAAGGVPPQREAQRTQRSDVRTGLGMMGTSVASMALGVVGLGVTWQVATKYLVAAKGVKVAADIVSLVSFNVGTTLFLAYMTKLVMLPKAVLEEALSSEGNANLPCLDMALMIMGWWLDNHGFHTVGRVLWITAVVAHVGLLLLFCARHLSKREWDPMTPAWMIPTVGIAMAAGTGASIGMGTWTGVFFWMAFAAFVVQYPAVLYRVHVHPSFIPDDHELLYPIFAAPPALLLTAWIAMGGHQLLYKSKNVAEQGSAEMSRAAGQRPAAGRGSDRVVRGRQGHALTHFLFLVEMVAIVSSALQTARPGVVRGAWVLWAGEVAQDALTTHVGGQVLVAMRLPHLAGLASLQNGKAPTTAYAFPCDVAAKACVLYTRLYLTGSSVMVACCWFFVLVATLAVVFSLSRFVRNGIDEIMSARAAGESVEPQEADYEL